MAGGLSPFIGRNHICQFGFAKHLEGTLKAFSGTGAMEPDQLYLGRNHQVEIAEHFCKDFGEVFAGAQKGCETIKARKLCL